MKKEPSSKKYELLKTSWTYQTKEFFDNSTLHGVRYIAEEGRPFCEKFLWFCCTSIGATVTLIIIVSLWEKFQTNPTITGLDTDFHNWDVEFPAVTACLDDPVDEDLVKEYINKNYKDFSDKDLLEDYITALGSLNYKNVKSFVKFAQEKSLPKIPDLKKAALEVVRRCEKVFEENCEWKDDGVRKCCDIFFPLFTERGFCYAFNSKHVEKEVPWRKGPLPEFKQEYIYETDSKWAFSFDITKVDENNAMIFIHSSDETPGLDMEPQHVWDNRVKKISFSAKTTYTTEDAKQLSIKQRRCVFSDELTLITNNVYTYGACMRECRIKEAFKKCKCIPFLYRKQEKYPYCDLNGLACIAQHREKLTSKNICPCELGCYNTVYEVDKLTEGAQQGQEPLEVAFVSWPMIRYKREVLFGWVDLLVAFGGIAGLFLGFSLLSGVEIIYYFTMRSCCMFVRDKKRLEELKKEYENAERPPLDLSLQPKFLKTEGNTGSAGLRTVHPIQSTPVAPAFYPNTMRI